MAPNDLLALRAFLNQPDTLLFVGSGLSLWSGIPGWRTIIERLVAAAEEKGARTGIATQALASGNLLEAADALQLTASEIAHEMRTRLGFSTATPHEIHALLTRLGPQRFVTTNYDTLIEQQLGKELRLGEFKTVTGRQVAELADIVKASASHFIFKPHGDISDAESLVLSTRQYERIVIGERNAVRSCLETLLVTRPIIFVGYGLRDLDTTLVLRTLRDRFLGNVSHFVAIVADATDEDREYWWERYRIRIYSYDTTQGPKGRRDHRALAEMLKALVQLPFSDLPLAKPMLATSGADDETTKHNLVQYVARLVRAKPTILFPVSARLGRFREGWERTDIGWLDGASVTDILTACHTSLILAGAAGSGKSFAIGNFMSRCARLLLDWEDARANDTPVPILLDARLYDGDFEALAKTTVPAALDLVSLSRIHDLVVIVDSLDEMPEQHLKSGEWRLDLEHFVSRFARYRVVFATRRASLVGRPELPIFHVSGLTEEIVRNSLRQVNVDANSLPSEFLSDLEIPFLLSLSRKILPDNATVRSAPDLLQRFIDQILADAPSGTSQINLRSTLARLAFELVEIGRETIKTARADAVLKGKSQEFRGSLVNHFVRSGLMTSEIDSHIRFIHRSVTEFLASKRIAELVESPSFKWLELLAARRWDNPLLWAAQYFPEMKLEEMVAGAYAVDPVVAHRIVASAEFGGTRLWKALLQAMQEHPPSQEQMHDIQYFEGSSAVPLAAKQELRQLVAVKNEEMKGWAMAQLAPLASDDEIFEWIDQLKAGEIEYNTSNFAGGVVGTRLSGELFTYFLKRLEETSFTNLRDSDGNEVYSETRKRFGFEATIAGLSAENIATLLRWAKQKSAAVRAIVCGGIHDRDDPGVYRFLLSEFDRGSAAALFRIYLMAMYQGHRPQPTPVPRYGKKRLAILLDALTITEGLTQKWAISLMHLCAERSHAWHSALTAEAKRLRKKPIGRAIKLVLPSTSHQALENAVVVALKEPAKTHVLERHAISTMTDRRIVVREEVMLRAVEIHGKAALELLSDWFFGFNSGAIVELTSSKIDRWIMALAKTFGSSDWHLGPRIFQMLAATWSTDGRTYILERANDEADPLSDMILGLIVPHLRGITTSELSSETSLRLLNLYVEGKLESFPTPGELATPEFVEETVIPFAQAIKDPSKQEAIDLILEDAGRLHDRRYAAPWRLNFGSFPAGREVTN